MIRFGLLSSFFDFLTFGLLLLLAVPVAQFRTGWFLESMLTEIFLLLVIRTGRVFYRSRASSPLLLATAGVTALTLLLPYLPIAPLLGFAPLPPGVLAALLGVSVMLVVSSEVAKRIWASPPGLK
jgi:Mg2+-importing ATPase